MPLAARVLKNFPGISITLSHDCSISRWASTSTTEFSNFQRTTGTMETSHLAQQHNATISLGQWTLFFSAIPRPLVYTRVIPSCLAVRVWDYHPRPVDTTTPIAHPSVSSAMQSFVASEDCDIVRGRSLRDIRGNGGTRRTQHRLYYTRLGRARTTRWRRNIGKW